MNGLQHFNHGLKLQWQRLKSLKSKETKLELLIGLDRIGLPDGLTRRTRVGLANYSLDIGSGSSLT